LQHVLEYCFVFAKGPLITQRHLPRLESAWLGRELELPLSTDWPNPAESMAPLQALEKKTILTALEIAGGKKQEAARLLKISRSKLWRKMRIYQITDFEKERES
jgi:DNA-binding NtrC family response regulator